MAKGDITGMWFDESGTIPVRQVDEIPAEGVTSIWSVDWGPPLPRTWWGRMALRWRVRRARLRDAWRVWKGDMEAREWGDE